MWRTSDEWEKIIKEAYTSDLPLKRWGLEHNIKDITFRKARERLLREGKLRFMEEKVLLPIDESRKWVRLPSENIRAILVLEPIRGNLSMESMASIIAFDLDLPLIPGQIFLYKENPVLDTGFVEAMRLNNNFPTVKLKLRSGNCNKV